MTAAAKFTQTDIKRAVKGALEAGMRVGSFEIDPNGKIIVHAAQAAAGKSKATGWDRVFDNGQA